MRKWLIIIGIAICGLCLTVTFPICKGYLNTSKIIEAVKQNNVTFVKTLLDKGVNVNTKNKEGETLLIISIKNKCKETTKLLLERGANIEVTYCQGQTT